MKNNKKTKKNKNNKTYQLDKLKLINKIILIGTVIAVLLNFLKQVLDIETHPILGNMVPFKDFTDFLEYFQKGDYSKLIGNYFPFGYVLMKIISLISFKQNILMCGFLYAVSIIIFLGYIYKTIEYKQNIKNLIVNIFIFLFIQFPILFVFQRGNIEFLILAFCLLFLKFYRDKKYNLAMLFLAFAACVKLYPALFSILFLIDKKPKKFIEFILLCIVITVISYLLLYDVFGPITDYIKVFTHFNDVYGTHVGMQYNHSILYGIYYFLYTFCGVKLDTIFNSSISFYYVIAIAIISIILVIYLIKNNMKKWEKITILTLMMISFPFVSFDYTLIFLIIPIIEFIKEETTKKENIIYSILFGLLLIPINFYDRIYYPKPVMPDVPDNIAHIILDAPISISISLFIKPLVIMTIILMIIISYIKKQKKVNASEQ